MRKALVCLVVILSGISVGCAGSQSTSDPTFNQDVADTNEMAWDICRETSFSTEGCVRLSHVVESLDNGYYDRYPTLRDEAENKGAALARYIVAQDSVDTAEYLAEITDPE